MSDESSIKAEENYVVVVGRDAGPLEAFAAEELGRYLSRLSGSPVRVSTAENWLEKRSGSPIAVGLAKNNPLVAEMAGTKPVSADLGPEGFILRNLEYRESPAWLITGSSEKGVLYGAYALLEEAGATFLISGDLLPEPRIDFVLPEIDRLREPAFERRGFLLPFPLNVHESIWGLEDYRLLIDQMAKLRLNYINLNITGADPMLEYTFRGEKNLIGDINNWETGFLTPKRFFQSGRTDQVEIGREHFVGRPFMAPPRLQGVRSQEEAHRRIKAMFHAVFEHARKRGVEIGFTMDATEIPFNFARFMRRIGSSPAHRRIAGARVDFTDPLFGEHTRAWLTALYETYPDAVDLFFWNAEGYLDYPEHGEMLERLRPQFAEAKEIFEKNWMQTSPYVRKKSAQDIIDADIIQMEATQRIIAISRQLRPGFTVGYGFLFRGYVLSSVHKVVDEDIPFMDFQSSGVIHIRNDVNAHYFAGMGERKRYIIPRIDDDGSMFGMPFYLRQFQQDGLFQAAKEAGVHGFVAQLFRGRGTEQHVQFLARGAWDTELTPERFYQDYAEEAFGPEASASMIRAFTLLEDSEELLGWRSLNSFQFHGGCVELGWLARELLNQDNPYDGPDDPENFSKRAKSLYLGIDSRVPAGEYVPGKIDLYRKSIGLLQQALRDMRVAEATVTSKGRSYLEYLSNKTQAYIAHLEMVAAAAEGLAAYADAFVNHAGDEPALFEALSEAEQHFVMAQGKAREAARIYARKIDHPSDLAILFLANVYNIQKADNIADLVRRVVNYHQGLPYWPEGSSR